MKKRRTSQRALRKRISPAWRSAGIYAIFLVALTAMFVWLLRPEPPPARDLSRPPQEPPRAARTVGEAWRWDAFRPQDRPSAPPTASPAPSSSRFDVASIHRGLREVALDESGNVVLDARALRQLESAFASLKSELTPRELEELQRIVRTGLPGTAGEQAAKILGDYYRYTKALQEFEAGVVVSDDVTAVAVRQQQLAALRQQYFGPEVAEKLFAGHDAYTRYTLETMRVQSAEDLSPEQKNQALAQLRQSLPPGVLPDKPGPDWERRYAAFARERQAVLDAGLTESDKHAQIERLLREHFRGDEIDAARDYLPPPGG